MAIVIKRPQAEADLDEIFDNTVIRYTVAILSVESGDTGSKRNTIIGSNAKKWG